MITIGEAGNAQVRLLHWETGTPPSVSNDSLRYGYSNLIDSVGLELDSDGQIISYEEYYPYGGSAVWAARSQTEADYKTVRYSGKNAMARGSIITVTGITNPGSGAGSVQTLPVRSMDLIFIEWYETTPLP